MLFLKLHKLFVFNTNVILSVIIVISVVLLFILLVHFKSILIILLFVILLCTFNITFKVAYYFKWDNNITINVDFSITINGTNECNINYYLLYNKLF